MPHSRPRGKKRYPVPRQYHKAAENRLPRIFWIVPVLIAIGMMAFVVSLLRDEMRTSKIQAEWLTWYAQRATFALQDGPNPALRTPTYGPYNNRLGYSYIPYFVKSLEANDYKISAQARLSDTASMLVDNGFYAVYNPKTAAGLAIADEARRKLYAASYPTRIFPAYAAIPPLLVDTLLYIENRELLRDGPVTRNPVIEWDRFFYAIAGHFMRNIVPGFHAGGGSTLATQIEKFRFSPGGQTISGADKIRQIISASLRVYLDGPDTRKAREKIVLDYMNSTPLGARPGFGEVNSIGDGLWAWFGIDIGDATTALNLPENDADSLRVKAKVYRAALGLILAQRRPSYYLASNRAALNNLTDVTLDRLAEAQVISPELRQAAKTVSFRFIQEVPLPPQPPFVEQKAVNALRNHLMSLLGLKRLYEVDRLDLSAQSTLDQATQRKVVAFLRKMGSREFLESIGLYGFRLLKPDNDPSKIKWSVVIYERGNDGNKLRVQADNIDEPFDMNEGVKLDLGSTAKMRTMVSYLEIISELHRRYAGLSAVDLQGMAEDAPDDLTAWAIEWLMENTDATLEQMLRAAMNRRYSASPGEVFFTGGGAHRFVNFERKEDSLIMDLHEAFRDSVNLVFIRLMRDIINYTIAQGAQTKEELLDDPGQPARQSYLERFAEREGGTFLDRYINEYGNLTPDQALDRLAHRGHKGATARTVVFRSIRPQADFNQYVAYMARFDWRETLTAARLAQLYTDYAADRYSLSDRGYIAGINPLELWLVAYLQANPEATRRTIMQVSKPVRIASYAWLYRPRLKHAQDNRIRIILEEDAFARLHKRWARLGYPFSRLVPSFATTIGSSGDRPGALAELVGIILNDGVRQPVTRFEKLEFASGTPYQTLLSRDTTQDRQQVLEPAIAKVMREVMSEVVENGTAKRVRGTYVDAQGNPLQVGGKTGTGDHRYEEFAPGGRLIASRVVNRTGTFAFYIGDRYFGAITAHVAGADASEYKFTSALSAQMLKALAPILQPMINGTSINEEVPVAGASPDTGKDNPYPAEQESASPEPGDEKEVWINEGDAKVLYRGKKGQAKLQQIKRMKKSGVDEDDAEAEEGTHSEVDFEEELPEESISNPKSKRGARP